jgi:peptide/nickel transport system permease protein
LSVRDQEYIEAANAAGTGDFFTIMQHIIPNCMAPTIVQATLRVGTAILNCSTLSFIGLGVSPPTAEWGSMISAGRQYLRSNPALTTYPGVAIMLTVFALNIMGDGLRDALDPKMKS